MAKKIMLFPLIITALLWGSLLSEAVATEAETLSAEELKMQNQAINAEDRSFFQGLAKTSRLVTAQEISKQYAQLLKMQGQEQSNSLEGLKASADDFGLQQPLISLKIFVSSSMNKELLKNYLQQARKYGASLIFKGLVDDSWVKTRKLIWDIAEDGKPASILIHDEEFAEFGVTSVPTIVLVQESGIADIGDADVGAEEKGLAMYDRVVGNIGIKGALELFAKEGNLSQQAQVLLEASK